MRKIEALPVSDSPRSDLPCLDAARLRGAEDSFKKWYLGAKTPAQSRTRARLWLAFLLLRYGGLRLGELLALSLERDLDVAESSLRVRGGRDGAGRTVRLPDEAARELARLLASPMFATLGERALQLDPGYLRRKLYERAAACGLPAELFNPRALRRSRAAELLRSGLPAQAVRAYMGWTGLGGLGVMALSRELTEEITRKFMERETRLKTSARNVFAGRVESLARDGLLAEVVLRTFSGAEIVAVITEESRRGLNLTEGAPAAATVKAPWVILAEKGAGLKTSACNDFSGRVAAVSVSEIAAEVVVELDRGDGEVCALVAARSVKNLDLKPGKEIRVMFKPFSVVLHAE